MAGENGDKGAKPETVDTRMKDIETEGLKPKEFDPAMLGLPSDGAKKDESAPNTEGDPVQDILDAAAAAEGQADGDDNAAEDTGGSAEAASADAGEPAAEAESEVDPFAFLDEEPNADAAAGETDATTLRIRELEAQVEASRQNAQEQNQQILELLAKTLTKDKEGEGQEEKSVPLFTKEELEAAGGDPEKMTTLLNEKIKGAIESGGNQAMEQYIAQQKATAESQLAAGQVAQNFYNKYPQLKPFAQIVSPLATEVLRNRWEPSKGPQQAEQFFGAIYDRAKEQLKALRGAAGARRGSATQASGQPDTGPSHKAPKGPSKQQREERENDPTTKGLDDMLGAMGEDTNNDFFTKRSS